MKSIAVLIISLLLSFVSYSQTSINGIVNDSKGMPIMGANVYLDGTYDGATTDEMGKFAFTTNNTGINKLIISFLAYETQTLQLEVAQMVNLKIILREDVDALDTVVITAGTFEAGDNSKASVLKPLDVVTTASAVGDVLGALQTLPGTSTNAEDGRLFVRGGSADETQIFIDGLRVFTPYVPTAGNTPTRGRYSPFLFDGISFSTGGYSAEYGEALSGVLLLNTIDEPDQEKTDIGLMTVGTTLGHTVKWDKSSLSVNGSYINLTPYIAVAPDRNEWEKPFESASGETVYRHKFNTGLFKFYAAFEYSNFALTQEDINQPEGLFLDLNNKNFYINSNYHGTLGNDWSIVTGLSLTKANGQLNFINEALENSESSIHAKAKFKKRFSSRFKLNFGAEHFLTNFDERFTADDFDVDYGINQNITAMFTEADIVFNKDLAFKAGLRLSKYSLLDQYNLSPRLALAYKLSEHGQASLAYGTFSQSASKDYLKFNSDLNNETTEHFIFNYNYINEGRQLRAEIYRKSYDNLVKFDTQFSQFNSNFSNDGKGYAQGLDIFWRDNKSLNNVDYWISYSYLDTERDYRNFPLAAQPNFANSHNFSAVAKYWVENWKSQLGFSYTYASGRPYNNPNSNNFLAEQTKSFNSLSLNWAYLIDQQKILYLSINNVLGFNNINGYQYANTPDANGNFARRTLRPAQDQFFFVGFFWTISDDKNENQLDNL